MNKNSQLIIVFQGSPGTGKSCYSKKLAKISNIPRIDRDEVKSEVIKKYTTREDPFCNQLKYKLLATNIFLKKAQKYLDENNKVILDGLIPKNEILDLFYKQFPREKYNIIEIYMYCSDKKLWETRYNNRKRMPNQSDKNFDKITDLEKQYLKLDSDKQIKIDASKDEKYNLKKIYDIINL